MINHFLLLLHLFLCMSIQNLQEHFSRNDSGAPCSCIGLACPKRPPQRKEGSLAARCDARSAKFPISIQAYFTGKIEAVIDCVRNHSTTPLLPVTSYLPFHPILHRFHHTI